MLDIGVSRKDRASASMARTDDSHALVSDVLESLKLRTEAWAKAASTVASRGVRWGCCAAVSLNIFRSLTVKLVGAVNRERVVDVGSATMLALELLRPLWIIFLFFPKQKSDHD
jgi:hypothetical protein